MRQLIIVRKDLNMSIGKTAAQVAHASMAFLTRELRRNAVPVYNCEIASCRNGSHYRMYRHPDLNRWSQEAFEQGKDCFAFRTIAFGKLELCEPKIEKYLTEAEFDTDVFEDWIDGRFVKTVCGARNKNQLLKAETLANELELVKNKDYGFIYDACLTELRPEEEDGSCLTCFWTRPLDDETAHAISRKYHLL